MFRNPKSPMLVFVPNYVIIIPYIGCLYSNISSLLFQLYAYAKCTEKVCTRYMCTSI